jgi:hypothetical protein
MMVFSLFFNEAIVASNLTKKVSTLNLKNAQFEQLEKETELLYKDLGNYIIQLQNSFVSIIKDKIDGLKDFSKVKADELFTFFNDQVEGTADPNAGIVGFRVWVHEKRDYMVSKYYAILKKIDPDFKYNTELSTYEQNFVQGVHDITSESIVLAQNLILDLSADVKKQKLSFDITQGFFESEIHAQMLYEEQLKKNQEKMNKDKWRNLKEEGSSFCELFMKHAKTIIITAITKQISTIGTKQSAKKGGIDINSVVMKKIGGLSNELQQDNINDLQDNKLSDVSIVLLRKAIRSKARVIPPATDVMVKTSVDLSLNEKNYLQNRNKKIQPILEKEFSIDMPLRIAMCCSGGGNRAMVGTLGFFMAAAKHNILQATTYIVGLSGSTWTIAPWTYLYSKGFLGSKDYIKSLEVLKNSFIATLSGQGMLDPLGNGAYTPPMLQNQSSSVLSSQLMDRFGYEQNISLVDIWGALVGSYALSLSKTPFKLESCWSEMARAIINADLPMPLCSAAFDARADVSNSAYKDVGSEYDWLETGPFEAGSTVLGYVPIQYFGSPFVHGKLNKELICPEYPMSFYLGIYGSAFSLTINDLVEKGLKNPTIDVFGISTTVPVASWVKSIAVSSLDSNMTSKRSGKIHAQLYNFSNGQNSSSLKKKYIGLFDGGIAFNIPLPLVIDRQNRAVDIVFMYDSNPGDFDTLKSADNYFLRKGIKMPSFSKGLRKADLTYGDFPWRVYNDPRDKRNYNAAQPTFIYFPTKVDVSNPPFATSNFKYTKDSMQDLMSIVQDNFEFHLDEIKEIMQKVAKARNSKLQSASSDQLVKKYDQGKFEKHDSSSRKIKRLKSSGGNSDNYINIVGINGEFGKYFPNTVPTSAYLIDQDGNKVSYTNIIKYSQAVTPPGKEYTYFATMPNPNYRPEDSRLAGGQFKVISLYGQLEQ